MFLELIMILVMLYVLYAQHEMHQASEVAGMFHTCTAGVARNSFSETAELPVISIPTRIIPAPIPTVTTLTSTDQVTTLAVIPQWYEQIEKSPVSEIRWPTRYRGDCPTDVRLYQCLATYRSMKNEYQTIDFIAQPFTAAVGDTETAVVALNELSHQLDARLTFTKKAFQYDDSAYRTACGVGNLGSIHSILAAEGDGLTAKFELHLKLNYDDITSSNQTLRNFTITLINDLADTATCKKEFIRVFSVSRASSIHVHWGLTTTEFRKTQQLAEHMKRVLNHSPIQRRQGILQYLIPDSYDYKWGAALSYLQLQASDFEPLYNRDYPQAREERRGGQSYYFPQGWYRHALKVEDKYPNAQVWLGMANSPGEWAVAYHGISTNVVRNITDTGLQHRFVTTDAFAAKAKEQRPSIPDVKGLYLATHCEGGASVYTRGGFKIKDAQGNEKTCHVVFQCRVENGKFTTHEGPVTVGLALRVFDEKAIRPYGLLLKIQ